MSSKQPGITQAGNNEMSNPMPSPATGSGRIESNRAEHIGHPADGLRAERDDWMHEFRNALGNITIAASAAKGELADQQFQHAASLMRQIEEGCERCLRLLRSMPR
jgi:hypothetical protein